MRKSKVQALAPSVRSVFQILMFLLLISHLSQQETIGKIDLLQGSYRPISDCVGGYGGYSTSWYRETAQALGNSQQGEPSSHVCIVACRLRDRCCCQLYFLIGQTLQPLLFVNI